MLEKMIDSVLDRLTPKGVAALMIGTLVIYAIFIVVMEACGIK